MNGLPAKPGGGRVFRALLAACVVASAIVPEDTCSSGLVFDAAEQRCTQCPEDASPGPAGECVCDAGLVECRSGQYCWVGDPSQVPPQKATEALECFSCPNGADGQPMAPTQSRTACLRCAPSPQTSGYSTETKDCLCPPGHALVERSDGGDYLAAKICVRCDADMLPGPTNKSLSVYECGPCPDPHRMARSPATGTCECKDSVAHPSGGACVDLTDFDDVNDKFPEVSAVEVTFRDTIDGREEFWRSGPFGTYLGLEERYDDIMEVMSVDAINGDTTAESAMIKWLYIRCAVSCELRNETACQCISNLCVLMLYEDSATACRVLSDWLYPNRPSVGGKQGWKEGMPWLFYAPETAQQIFQDDSLDWRFVLQDEVDESGSTNSLTFWLASYSLEGAWLGWSKVTSQLDLCARLGGTSATPRGAPNAWMRFGGSLTGECTVDLDQLENCGVRPVFHDLFVENVDGSLVPVPVRILNLMKDQKRPNLNRIPEDLADDVLVRRFTLCDSLSGREGDPEAVYLQPEGYSPVAYRWAAHMAIQVRLRADTEGQIYVPVLSIAYADKKTGDTEDDAQLAVAAVSFKAEYSMETSSYWTVVIVLFVLLLVAMLGVAVMRMYNIAKRYPTMPPVVAAGDAPIFVPKPVLLGYAAVTTAATMLFWFHFSQGLYWYVMFKAQSAPHVLLPSAFEGDQYEPHDVMLVITFILGTGAVAIGLFRQLKVFFFLVDWERGRQSGMGPQGSYGQPGMQSPYGQQPQAVGAPLLAAGGGQHPGVAGGVDGAAPDQGVSAWRSIFICNELNERLTQTHSSAFVTWLAITGLLEGAGLKNGARWYPRFSGNEAMMTAQYNPFLQFGLSAILWMLVLICQFAARRIGSIVLGDDLIDFIDLCSVANVSVVFMDEPFHGYYIHGRAPSNNSDVCHTDLARALAKEGKGIGFGRGLTRDDCQTFEMFLPPELGVMGPGAERGVSFRRELLRIFNEVRTTESQVAERRPPRPTESDIAEMSRHRCAVQALIDSFVNAIIKNVDEVVSQRASFDWFMGTPPAGGVASMRKPVFYRDQDGPSMPNGVAWSSCLAYGAEVRFMGIGLPTGFEWHLILLEFLLFSIVWRFYGSVYLSAVLACMLNKVVLTVYGVLGKSQLSHTTIINPMFLI